MKQPAVWETDGLGAVLAPDQTATALVALTTSRQSVAVPTGATHVIFGGTVAFFAAYSASAGSSAVSASTATSSGCEVVNPVARDRARWLGKGNVAEITLMAPTAGGYVSLDFRGST